MKMLDHTLYGNNIQFDSLKEFYGDNILLILNPLELPECEPVKTLYYKDNYSDNGKTPFVKFCELKKR
ncbi:hypothetical protein EOM09_04300 [bacterium]|nr:hypothetical protein [bacterium]